MHFFYLKDREVVDFQVFLHYLDGFRAIKDGQPENVRRRKIHWKNFFDLENYVGRKMCTNALVCMKCHR